MAPVTASTTWRSRSLVGDVQSMRTVMEWVPALVPEMVRPKRSHGELLQSAASGSLVDPVTGPPDQLKDVSDGETVPDEGFAARAAFGAWRERGNAKARSSESQRRSRGMANLPDGYRSRGCRGSLPRLARVRLVTPRT